MGKCCVAGCEGVYISEDNETKETSCEIGGNKVNRGDWITTTLNNIDGSKGEVFLGRLPTVDPKPSEDFLIIMEWAGKYKKLKIKANADTPHDAEIAKNFGAEGIGLCRTEHMFFDKDRIMTMRKMILAEKLEERQKYLEELLPYQKNDFKEIFKVMNDMPCIIRLLDPPLHEFLPQDERLQKQVAEEMKISPEKIKEAVASLHEFNPMLGFRGCRLGVKYPEINHMQCRAIFMAAMECINEGLKPLPYIEVPLVGHYKELLLIKDIMEDALKVTGAKDKVNFKFGSMIEVPRGALTTDEIAKDCDFVSFGTNDLTQMACGFSRDDIGKFIKHYLDKGIYDHDPFVAIDRKVINTDEEDVFMKGILLECKKKIWKCILSTQLNKLFGIFDMSLKHLRYFCWPFPPSRITLSPISSASSLLPSSSVFFVGNSRRYYAINA